MSRTIEHDGRASLRVAYRRASFNFAGGWRVLRACTCHFGEAISVSFDSRAKADRLVDVLDEDARRYAPPASSAGG